MSEGVRGAANAQFYAMEITGCKTALKVEKTNPIGMVFTKCLLQGVDHGVKLTNQFDSVVMFAMCSLAGRKCLDSDGVGSVVLQKCVLEAGDVEADGGAISLSACEFADGNSRVVLGKQVVGASLTGVKGDPQIVNQAGKDVLKTSRQELSFKSDP